MNKTNDKIDKIILKFEENGFSSNSNTNRFFAFKKAFRKEIYRLDICFDLWTEDIGSIVDINFCDTLFILSINCNQKTSEVISFDHNPKCPLILSLIAEFIIDLFLFMRRSEIDLSISSEDGVLVINKNLKNEMFLHVYHYDKFLEFQITKEQYSGTAIFTLDEIIEGNKLSMFEKVKDVISKLDTI